MSSPLNLSELSYIASQLNLVTGKLNFGDHILHFEHEIDGPFILALIFCEKCDTEKRSVKPVAALRSAPSAEMIFVEMFHLAMKDFEQNVRIDCKEARHANICKEVLDE